MVSPRRVVPLVAVLVWGGGPLAHAGGVDVPCNRPSVFPGAAVNVMVLPYSAPREIAASADVGREVARLVQAELLLSIAKFGSVGAIQLVSGGAPCEPDAVLARVLGDEPGAQSTLRAGHAVVLVWGRIFRNGEDLYLQTYVRFTRRGGAAPVALAIAGETFHLRPMGDAFACVPRKIAHGDLRKIAEHFQRTEVLYSEPQTSATRVALPSYAPFSYHVTDIRGDWMRVQGGDGGPSGWLFARADEGGWSLRALMPELSFVEGVAGWMRLRVAEGDRAQPAPAGTPEAADRAIATYQKTWRAGAMLPANGAGTPAGFQPLAVAIPLQIRAMIAVTRAAGGSLDALDEAQEWAARASRLAPYSAEARNVDTVVSLARAYLARKEGIDVRGTVAGLERALADEPSNQLVLQNVIRGYRLLLAPATRQLPGMPPLSPSDRADAQRQLEALTSLVRAG